MSVTDAAREATFITGFNECMVRRCSKELFNNLGRFRDSKQGRRCLFNDEDLSLEAVMWVHENAYNKGEGNAIAQSFCDWINNYSRSRLILCLSRPATMVQQWSWS